MSLQKGWSIAQLLERISTYVKILIKHRDHILSGSIAGYSSTDPSGIVDEFIKSV